VSRASALDHLAAGVRLAAADLHGAIAGRTRKRVVQLLRVEGNRGLDGHLRRSP
jgi:hypothetical protein